MSLQLYAGPEVLWGLVPGVPSVQRVRSEVMEATKESILCWSVMLQAGRGLPSVTAPQVR